VSETVLDDVTGADGEVDGVDTVDETPAPAPVRAPRPIATGPVAATGRRKQAIARVRLIPGNGTWTINGRTIEDYFPNKVHQQIVNEPFVTLDVVGAYDVLVRVQGGGISGQAGAVRLGSTASADLRAGGRSQSLAYKIGTRRSLRACQRAIGA
jgi:small subunit ribosomal protein S9